MPVVVELLLVDEEREHGAPEAHLPLAKGLFSDIERQLQDATSHLRRKSVFGNLVSRGATVAHVADEQLPLAKSETPTPVVQQIEARHEAHHAPSSTFSSVEPAEVPAASSQPLDAQNNECALQVPPINRFPKTPTTRKSASAAMDNWWPVIFDWWPSTCTPTPCKALTGMNAGGCKISVSDPMMDQCLPVPSRNSNDGTLTDHEAGLGGWPLSLPSTFAAFPFTSDSIECAFAPANASSVSASALASAALRSAAIASFRKAAIEVDDEELTVILTPQKNNKSASGSSRTPSTASTMAPPSPQVGQPLPSVVAYSRLVFPLSTLKAVKLWPKSDVLCCWPNGVSDDPSLPSSSLRDATTLRTCDPGLAWTDVMEVAGWPRGAERELTTLLALPNTALAKRLQDALQRRPRRGQSCNREGGSGFVGAIRCELHIPADIPLGAGSQTNFSAVVRRGICEACHVSADRVRVCSMRNTSFEKTSSSQKDCISGYLEPTASTSSDRSIHLAPETCPPTSVPNQQECDIGVVGDTAICTASAEEVVAVAAPPEPVSGQSCNDVANQDTTESTENPAPQTELIPGGMDIKQQTQEEKSPSRMQLLEAQAGLSDCGEFCVTSDSKDDAPPVVMVQASLELPSNETKDEDGVLLVAAATGETPLRRGISEPLIDLSDKGELTATMCE